MKHTHAMKYFAPAVIIYNGSILVISLGWLANHSSNLLKTDQPVFDWHMVFAVSLLGAIGGSIHGLASVTEHQGNQDLKPQWAGFYVARPFLGAGMALATCLILASGVGGFQVEERLPLMAWSLLAGLYSQAALDKLKEIFDTIFRTEKKPGGQASSRPTVPESGGAESTVAATTTPHRETTSSQR